MDSWMYNKTIRFINDKQKHAADGSEQNCSNFVGTSQMSV